MTAISQKARIGENVTHGHNTIIEDDFIGDNVEIGHNVVTRSGVRIGDNCKILDGAILGKRPAKASLSAITGETKEYSPLVLGKAVTVGASCILYIGAEIGDTVFFGDQATVREDVKIGEYTKIGRKCKIETEAYIIAMINGEDYYFIVPEVTFTNGNFLRRTEERKKDFIRGAVLNKMDTKEFIDSNLYGRSAGIIEY
jgi:UDP-3-O-[3-hydroxymyristoyl] glucosamine N-acyltransferase